MFLLWFNEFEANYVLGIFETKDDAVRWKQFFIANPVTKSYPDMEYYARKDAFGDRFIIEEREMGVSKDLKVDNLKYVEWLYEYNKTKPDGQTEE